MTALKANALSFTEPSFCFPTHTNLCSVFASERCVLRDR